MLTSRRGIRSYVPALMRLGVLAVGCAAVLAAGSPAVLGQTQEEPAGGLGPPVDATDTDVYVNQFLKTIVASGATHLAASVAWRGPTARLFHNQQWTVVKNLQPGARDAPDAPLT